MLIPFATVYELLQQRGIQVQGILHIGAHDCEEREHYNAKGITDENIVWVEGNPDKVRANQAKGIPLIYQGLIYDTEKEVDFHITANPLMPGNTESSSILPLGIHAHFYPHIQVNEVRKMTTTTIERLVRMHHIPIQRLNFWNLDIQGVELEALKGAEDMIAFADAIYVEINQLPLYQGGALLPSVDQFLQSKGFVGSHIKMAEQGWGDALYVRKV